MRVAIFMTSGGGGYGGGRLAGYTLAECLAYAGVEVCVVSEAVPVFHPELHGLGAPGQVALYVTKDFHSNLPEGGFDVVVVVPGQSRERLFYIGARGFASRRGARLVLFSFETPNWFNETAPQPRDPALWAEWVSCAREGGLVLCNSHESQRYAQAYYPAQTSSGQPLRYGVWHQPVNMRALAAVAEQYREKRVVAFVRPQDAHKGGQDLLDVLSADLRGWVLSILVGSARLDEAYRVALEGACRRYGIGLEVRCLVPEVEKYIELKRARVLVYPSHFEGYGLPPIEALASGTACLCYDLPVFWEVCGPALLRVSRGDVAGLRRALRGVLQQEGGAAVEAAATHPLPSIASAGEQAKHLFRAFCQPPQFTQDSTKNAKASPRVKLRPTRPEPPLLGVISVEYSAGGALLLRGWNALPGRVAVELHVTTEQGSSTEGSSTVLTQVLQGLALPAMGPAGPPEAAGITQPATGFAVTLPALPRDGGISLLLCAIAPDGTVMDGMAVALPAADAPINKPSGDRYQRGGVRAWQEADSGVITGWVMTKAPLLRLEAFAGARRLWAQIGRSRPDVLKKFSDFPDQKPGFSIHLNSTDMRALGSERLALVATTTEGMSAEALSLNWEDAPASAPVSDLPSAADCAPLLAEMHAVTRDEYDVVSFSGYVLASPRIEAVRFWLGAQLLGETPPERLEAGFHARHRQYGDAFGGFHYPGRAEGAAADLPWRAEFLRDGAVVHQMEGIPRDSRRVEATLGATLLCGAAQHMSAAVRPLVMLLLEPGPPHSAATDLALRRVQALRGQDADVILLLHGTPSWASHAVPDWRHWAEGCIVMDPLLPGVMRHQQTEALPQLLHSMCAAALPISVFLGGVGSERALAACAAAFATAQNPPVCQGWGEWGAAKMPALATPEGAMSSAPIIPPMNAPVLAAPGRWLVLEASGLAPAQVAAACRAALPVLRAHGLVLGVVVDAAPLETVAALRARFLLPEDATPFWGPELAPALPSLRAVVELGAVTLPPSLLLAAQAAGVRVGLWREQAVALHERPWPTLPLALLLLLPPQRPKMRPLPMGAQEAEPFRRSPQPSRLPALRNVTLAANEGG